MNIRRRVVALSIVPTISYIAGTRGEGKHSTGSGSLHRGANSRDQPAIKFDHKPSPLKVIDNGRTIQVNYSPRSTIDISGVRYELVKWTDQACEPKES
jgi:carbonic anhydrase